MLGFTAAYFMFGPSSSAAAAAAEEDAGFEEAGKYDTEPSPRTPRTREA